MPRPSGLPKTGGRKSGTPNKRTVMLSDALAKLGCDVPSKLIELLPQLTPDKQAGVLLGLLPYLYPKRSATELDQNGYQLIQTNRKQALRAFPDIDMSNFESYLRISQMTNEQKIAHAKNIMEKSALLDRYDKEFEGDERREASRQQK